MKQGHQFRRVSDFPGSRVGSEKQEATMEIFRVARICAVLLIGCQSQAHAQFNKQEIQTLLDLTGRFLTARQDLTKLSETATRSKEEVMNTYSCVRELYHELVFTGERVNFSIDLLTLSTKMTTQQDREAVNKIISRNLLFDLYNMEESRSNITRLVSSCTSSSPAIANYARMSLSLVSEAERSFSSIISRLPRP